MPKKPKNIASIGLFNVRTLKGEKADTYQADLRSETHTLPDGVKVRQTKKTFKEAEWQAWEVKKTIEDAKLEREKKLLEKAEEAQREKFPRWGQWDSISDDELQKLVWSMSTTQVARQFGITDSCIGKRCRKFGIKKPPRGFWAKVEAGKLPHPQGKPVKA